MIELVGGPGVVVEAADQAGRVGVGDAEVDQQDVAATAATDWLIDRLATEGLRDER